MKGKSKLAAATVLAAAAAIFGACRADDTTGGAAASRASSKDTAATTTAAKPSPSVVAPAPAEDARRVTAEELKGMIDSGKVAIYDTRAKATYEAEHIKGALSMPSNEVADRAGELPKDKTLVFYCT